PKKSKSKRTHSKKAQLDESFSEPNDSMSSFDPPSEPARDSYDSMQQQQMVSGGYNNMMQMQDDLFERNDKVKTVQLQCSKGGCNQWFTVRSMYNHHLQYAHNILPSQCL